MPKVEGKLWIPLSLVWVCRGWAAVCVYVCVCVCVCVCVWMKPELGGWRCTVPPSEVVDCQCHRDMLDDGEYSLHSMYCICLHVCCIQSVLCLLLCCVVLCSVTLLLGRPVSASRTIHVMSCLWHAEFLYFDAIQQFWFLKSEIFN